MTILDRKEAARTERRLWTLLQDHNRRCGCNAPEKTCFTGDALRGAWVQVSEIRIVSSFLLGEDLPEHERARAVEELARTSRAGGSWPDRKR